MRADYQAPPADSYRGSFMQGPCQEHLDPQDASHNPGRIADRARAIFSEHEAHFPRQVPAWALVPRSFRREAGESGEVSTISQRSQSPRAAPVVNATSTMSVEDEKSLQGESRFESEEQKPGAASRYQCYQAPSANGARSLETPRAGRPPEARGQTPKSTPRGSTPASRSASARRVQILRTPPRHLVNDLLRSWQSEEPPEKQSSSEASFQTAAVPPQRRAGLPSGLLGRPMRKRSFPPPRAPGRQADGPRIGGFIPSSKQVSSAGKDTLEAEASTQHDVEASRARTPSPAGKGSGERYRHWSADGRLMDPAASSRDKYTAESGRSR